MNWIDISTMPDLIISGFVGLLMGIIGSWVAHRFERKRDDIAWARESEKLKEQFNQEKELLTIQFQLKLKEMQLEEQRAGALQLRSELLRGVDNPEDALRGLRIITERLRKEKRGSHLVYPADLYALPLLSHIEAILENQAGDEKTE
ncbi:MAG: hypothetical protein FJZ87_16145 [Chloroflexi bacterium]|nr:hypothetical protein [Chloroflexota bacterium]